MMQFFKTKIGPHTQPEGFRLGLE